MGRVRSLFHFTLDASSLEAPSAFYTKPGFRVLRNDAGAIGPDSVATRFELARAQGRGALPAVDDGELYARLDLLEWLEAREHFPSARGGGGSRSDSPERRR